MELKDLPGAFYCENGEGPVLKLLKSLKDELKMGNLRGALYELEIAQVLNSRGEVISFGQMLRNASSRRDFDIITETMLIECKSIDWSRSTVDELNTVFSRLKQQADIAIHLKKDFAFFSKNKICDYLKSKLIEKKINFFEGIG